MREVVSPLKNPNWRWGRGPTFFQNVKVSGEEVNIVYESKKDRYGWIADIESFWLDHPNFVGSKAISCHSYRFFGKEPVLQAWGFASDMEKKGGRSAVCVNKRWYLIEKGDELIIEAGEELPVNFVTLTIRSHQGEKTITVYRK